MKKLILVLAVLALAAPALADPVVKASQETVDVNIVVITYDVNEVPDGNLFRAFGLTVTVSAGTMGTPYDLDPNFYIYPGSIVIAGGVVSNYGDAVADEGAGFVTLEMGSLYASNDPNEDHRTAPAKTGVLCRFTVSESCTVTPSADGTRGGVVMEDTEGSFTIDMIPGDVVLGWPYPACWDYNSFCYGDSDDSVFIDTLDWPAFRDAFFKNYWDHYPANDQNPQPDEYNPAGDWNRDGTVDTLDWPAFRDNFFTTPPINCIDGDPCEVYKAGSVKP